MGKEKQLAHVFDLSVEGEGIARTKEGAVFFVPEALPGDILEISAEGHEKHPDPRAVRWIQKREREPSFCPCFSSGCGGCAVQELPYETLLSIKERRARDCIQRIAGIDPEIIAWEKAIPSPEVKNYRNHVQLKLEAHGNSFDFGFYSRKAHQLVPHQSCPISATGDPFVRSGLLRSVDSLSETGRQSLREGWQELIIRSSERTGEILAALRLAPAAAAALRTERHFAERAADEIQKALPAPYIFSSLWILDSKSPEGDQLLWGKAFITEILCEKTYRIGPRAFFQVNTEAAERLLNTARHFLEESAAPARQIMDLYCGMGSVGLSLADESASIYGIDISEEAIQSARYNARANGIRHARYQKGKAEDGFPSLHIEKDSLLVVDPPRRGLAPSLVTALCQSPSQYLMYISCHPGTLARDLERLKSRWRPLRIAVVDLFPWTMHVETIALIQKM